MAKWKVVLKVMLSALILFLVINQIGIGRIFKTFAGINLWFMTLLLITLPMQFILATLVLDMLVRCTGKGIGFVKMIVYIIRSYSLGMFAPAKIGEISFIYFLKKEGIELGRASAVFVLEKITTLITLSLVGSLGIFILLKGEQRIVILVFIVLIISMILILIMSNFGREIIKRFVLRKYAEMFSGFSKTLFYLVREKPHIVLLSSFLALTRWSIGALSVYIIFIAFGYNPGFFYVWIILPLTIIMSLIPITIAGLGIKEGSAVLLFSIIGVPSNISASVYFTFTAINYIMAGIVCIYYLYKKPNENTNIKPIISKA